MNPIEQIMALHDAAVEREVEYRDALRIDVGVREAGVKSAEADKTLRAAIEQALEALEKSKAALAEELSAWDIDPPLHHILEAHDLCVPAITALRTAIKQAAHPAPVQEPNEADELLVSLGLDPQAYRTDGGAINYLKVKAAMRHPAEYATKREHITDGNPCWCNPETDYVDPETGVAVLVHKEPQ